MTHLKQKLYQHCLAVVQEQIQAAQNSIQAADDAAKNETKSSAGDKHETGRAMIHLEKEQHLRRLKEALAHERVLQQIDITQTYHEACEGAVVQTGLGNYFIAISAGKLQIDAEIFITISLASPIGEALEGLEASESFSFRGQEIPILSVA